MSARVVTFANQKGGVGKTTTAVTLSAALARKGQRVLLFDLDPQANATSAVGVNGDDYSGSYEALMGDAPTSECIVRVEEEFIDVVPARPALAGAEVELVPALARERKLSLALDDVRDKYDWILVDCPPSLGLLTINALTASDLVLVPVQCEYMALEGLSRLMETLDLVRENLNMKLSVLGILLTMYDARTRLSQQVVEEVRSHFPTTFATVIPRAVRLSEAPSHGQTIFRYEPGGRSAAAYDDLATEVLERTGVAV